MRSPLEVEAEGELESSRDALGRSVWACLQPRRTDIYHVPVLLVGAVLRRRRRDLGLDGQIPVEVLQIDLELPADGVRRVGARLLRLWPVGCRTNRKYY